MANTFALILAIATLVTGIIWCVDKFKWAPARRAKLAALNAQASGSIDEKIQEKILKQPGWVETGASVFPVLLLVFVVRSFLYEPFQIPSGSMMPTLLIGDFILVEKYAYGIKEPITQTTLIETGHPKRGDVAVFKFPLDTKLDYIKRVVGVPGDRVIYNPASKEVTIIPTCDAKAQQCEKLLSVTYSNVKSSDLVQLFSRNSEGKFVNGFQSMPLTESVPSNGVRLEQRVENLAGINHQILLFPGSKAQLDEYYQQPGQPFAQWVVPAGHYFMMGDNRDNSADSRYWGFVPEKNLVGKATAIWMSFEKQEGEWPTGVRLSRIGKIQ